MNEIFPQSPDEFLWIFHIFGWECINPEVQGGEFLDNRIIREYTDVGSRPEAGKSIDESDIASFNEDQINNQLKRKGNCTYGFFIREIFLFVLENSFVGHWDLGLLCDLT